VEWAAHGLPPGLHLPSHREVCQTLQPLLLEAERRAERRIERLRDKEGVKVEVREKVKVEVKVKTEGEIRVRTHVPTPVATQVGIRPDEHREILRETRGIQDFRF
jgi:hypothetical protein